MFDLNMFRYKGENGLVSYTPFSLEKIGKFKNQHEYFGSFTDDENSAVGALDIYGEDGEEETILLTQTGLKRIYKTYGLRVLRTAEA